jgi:hypothetical protein
MLVGPLTNPLCSPKCAVAQEDDVPVVPSGFYAAICRELAALPAKAHALADAGSVAAADMGARVWAVVQEWLETVHVRDWARGLFSFLVVVLAGGESGVQEWLESVHVRDWARGRVGSFFVPGWGVSRGESGVQEWLETVHVRDWARGLFSFSWLWC